MSHAIHSTRRTTYSSLQHGGNGTLYLTLGHNCYQRPFYSIYQQAETPRNVSIHKTLLGMPLSNTAVTFLVTRRAVQVTRSPFVTSTPLFIGCIYINPFPPLFLRPIPPIPLHERTSTAKDSPLSSDPPHSGCCTAIRTSNQSHVHTSFTSLFWRAREGRCRLESHDTTICLLKTVIKMTGEMDRGRITERKRMGWFHYFLLKTRGRGSASDHHSRVRSLSPARKCRQHGGKSESTDDAR